MKPDTRPAVSAVAEAQWVEAELVRSLLRTQFNTRFLGVVLIPVFVAVLWRDASALALACWTLLIASVTGLRLQMLHRYVREVQDAGPAAQVAFMQRWRVVVPLKSALWGLGSLLFFDRVPLRDQFVCWLLLAGLAMITINTLSGHLATLRSALDALALTVLVVMGWHLAVDLHFHGEPDHLWMLLLAVLFWQVLRASGARQHARLRRSYELQYRNAQLIESLTRQTQAALDAVEIKNRFLASAAHDIRQPVHALGLYADWLRSEPELVHEIAPKIVESTKAVNALFDSLFDLVRLDSGKIRLNLEEVRLDKLLRDLELQHRPMAEAKGLRLLVHAVPGTVVTDPILLQRVVGNLISNAVKYTDAGGVLVAVRMNGRVPRIEIWDTGVGIAPAHQREIFREFFKVPAHSGTEDGFGLGLYIVARLSHILGHPLQMASRPGRGTVFRVLLEPTDLEAARQRAAASVDSIRAAQPDEVVAQVGAAVADASRQPRAGG